MWKAQLSGEHEGGKVNACSDFKALFVVFFAY